MIDQKEKINSIIYDLQAEINVSKNLLIAIALEDLKDRAKNDPEGFKQRAKDYLSESLSG